MLPTSPERRRDRRHHVTGHVRLRPADGAQRDLFGGIVDVSAGGTRLRVRPGVRVEPGCAYLLDLEVAMPEARGPVPPVRLKGRAIALRLDPSATPRGAELSLRFEGPLRVSDGFAILEPPPSAPCPEPTRVG